MDTRVRQHALGFWEIAVKPNQRELQEYYAKKYYQESVGSYEREYSAGELQYFQAKLQQRWAVIERWRQSKAPGRLLDVGCGEGYALAFFRARQWQVKGLDFSSAGLLSKNPQCQDALRTGDLFELLATEISAQEKYDVVWLQNVLEHVSDPLALLQSLRSLVAKGGIAVITVPNDFSITQQCALDTGHINRQFWVAPPDHLSYFDHKSLSATVAATGWNCSAILADFPVDWFLFHPGSNYVCNTEVGKDAHRARVQLENLIHSRPIDDVVRFWSALAALGFGRDLTAFISPQDGRGE